MIFGQTPIGKRPLGASNNAAVILQYQRPSSDVLATGWSPVPSSPTTLYDKVNEVAVDDTNYITSTAS